MNKNIGEKSWKNGLILLKHEWFCKVEMDWGKWWKHYLKYSFIWILRYFSVFYKVDVEGIFLEIIFASKLAKGQSLNNLF